VCRQNKSVSEERCKLGQLRAWFREPQSLLASNIFFSHLIN
jgi:hypothetical protein